MANESFRNTARRVIAESQILKIAPAEPTIDEEKEVSHYEVFHRQSGRVVAKAKTKNGARRSVDNNDNKYGGYAHHYRPVYKEDFVDSEEDLVENTEAKEDVEQIDEISKEKTAEYLNNAKKDKDEARLSGDKDRELKRIFGVAAAKRKLAKEEVEELDESEYDETKHHMTVFTGKPRYTDKKAADYRKLGYRLDKKHVHPDGSHTYRMIKDKTTKEEADVLSAEEIERLDELSKDTLNSYVKKAGAQASSRLRSLASVHADNHRGFGATSSKVAHDFADDSLKVANKRLSGVKKASDKLAKEETEEMIDEGKSGGDRYKEHGENDNRRNKRNWQKRSSGDPRHDAEMSKEDVLVDVALMQLESVGWEQLDELSKATLGRYVKKATGDLSGHSIHGAIKGHAGETKAAIGHIKIANKRNVGIHKAIDKLTKEEFDELCELAQLDELSKDTLMSYARKAKKDAESKMDAGSDKERAAGRAYDRGDEEGARDLNKAAKGHYKAARKRMGFVQKARNKATKEEVDTSTQGDIVETNNNQDKGSEVKEFDIRNFDKFDEQVEVEQEDTVVKTILERRGRPPKEGSAAWHKAQEAKDSGDEHDDGARSSVKQVHKGSDNPAGGPVTIGGVSKHYTRAQHRNALSKMRAPGKPHEKEAREKHMFSSHENFAKHC